MSSLNNRTSERNVNVDTAEITTSLTVAGQLPVLSADGLVKTANIDDGQVTTDKLASNAVTADKLSSSATVDANRAVGTNHIQNLAVTETKINSGAVTTAKIGTSAVTTAKIANGAITYAKSRLRYYTFSGSGGGGAIPWWTNSNASSRYWGFIPNLPANSILRECRFTTASDTSRTGTQLAVEIALSGQYLKGCVFNTVKPSTPPAIDNRPNAAYGQLRGTTAYPDFTFSAGGLLHIRYAPAKPNTGGTVALDYYTPNRYDTCSLVIELP